MVRTHGGHRYRPRVQTSTPARDGAGTTRAAAGHSLAQDTEAPPAMAPDAAVMQSPTSAAILEEAQGSEPPSRQYHTRVGDSCHSRVIRNQQNLYPKFHLLP